MNHNNQLMGWPTKPPDGLDATPEQVRLFLRDPGLLDLWDTLTVKRQGSNGTSNNPAGRAGKPEKGTNRDDVTVSSLADNSTDKESDPPDSAREPERGNSRQYAIRKLRKDAPEIHAEVMANKLSPHAGMVISNAATVEAGFLTSPMGRTTGPIDTVVFNTTYSPLSDPGVPSIASEIDPLSPSPPNAQPGSAICPASRFFKESLNLTLGET